MTSRIFDIDRDSSVSGGPDGPIPVQRGDVVMVVVAKSWESCTETLREVDAKRKASARG